MPSDSKAAKRSWLTRLTRRIRFLFDPSGSISEVDEEFLGHVEMEIEELVMREGISRPEARRRALIAFGGIERFREEAIGVRGFLKLDDLVRDLRQCVRSLGRRPSYTLTSVVTLGVGVGGAATVFAVLNGVLLRPLPFPDPDRLVSIAHSAPGLGLDRVGLSAGTYLHYSNHAATLQSIASYTEAVGPLSDGAPVPELIRYVWVGPEFARVLGLTPALGRLFVDEDQDPYRAEPGRDNRNWRIPAVISYSLWQSRYGADPSVLGREVMIGTSPRVIIGVLHEGMEFPTSDTSMLLLGPPVGHLSRDFSRSFSDGGVARLRPGTRARDAEMELLRLIPSMEGEYPDATAERIAEVSLSPQVRPLKQEIVGGSAAAVWALFGGALFLLLVAISNVVNLALLRSRQRRREMGIRAAIGAGRAHLTRGFLMEALVLCALGGLLGVMLAESGVSIALRSLPAEFPRLSDIRLDRSVLAFALAVAGASAVAVGLFSSALHRDMALGAIVGPRASVGGVLRAGARQVFLIGQLSLSLVLVSGCGLALATYARLVGVPLGFDPTNRVAVEFGIPGRNASGYERIFYELVDAASSVPGVTGAAIVTSPPLTGVGGYARVPLHLEGSGPRGVPTQATLQFFTPGYLQLVGAGVVEGSGIASLDPDDFPSVSEFPNPVLVSRALAQRISPGRSAVGARLHRLESDGSVARMFQPSTRTFVDNPPYTIAGVVEDTRDTSQREAPSEIVYVPIRQPRVEPAFVPTNSTLMLMTSLGPEVVAPALKARIGDAVPEVSVGTIEAMSGIVRRASARERFLAGMLTVASGMAILIAAVGVYGTVSTTVRERTSEFAIRSALGARFRSLSWLGVRDSVRAVLIGVSLGALSAVALTRLVESVWFGVSPSDPVILVASALLVGVIAIMAALGPSLRLTRVDPMAVLKGE